MIPMPCPRQGFALVALLALALAGGTALPARAQGARIIASVDQQSINLGDTVHFTLSVVGGGLRSLPEVQLGDMSGFEVVGKQTAQMITNGQAQFDWVYTLAPRRSGDLTIGAATVRFGNSESHTKPIRIQVSNTPGAGTAPATSVPSVMPSLPPGGIDVKLSVDKPNPYIGEQVILTFTLVQGVNLYGSIGFNPPTAEGCVIEQLPPPETQRLVSVDREALVFKRQWALFAASAGAHVVKPASVTFKREIGDQEQELQSKPVTINVQSLPSPPPGLSYGGAVGQFTASARADKAQLRAGEGVNVIVTVTGVGNINSFEAPKPIIPAGCNVYPAGEKRDVSIRTTGSKPQVEGTAVFTYLLVPREAGTLQIPGIPFAFFDPRSHQYQVTRTQPIGLSVQPGDVVPEEGQTPADIAALRTGLRGAYGHAPLPFRLWFLVLNVLPLLALGYVLQQRLREIAVARDPVAARFGQAARRAQRRCGSLRTTGKQALGDLEHILRCYLADKLNLPEQGLTVDDFRRILLGRGVAAEYANRATDALQSLQDAHFAPWEPTTQECAEAVRLVQGLVAQAEREGLIGNA